MTDIPSDRRAAFRAAIERFLQERRDAKLEKLSDDDPGRDVLLAQFVPATWIDDAARRVGQIQAVTHSLKAIHPDARGTNLYRRPEQLPQRAEIGSHALGADFAGDVVGNAAALDVYKFLRLEVDGRSLLDWMLADDIDLKAALGNDPQQIETWTEAFTGLVQPRGAGATSHTRAKQLYWLTGDDPGQDGHYHLLAPLYASSLAHAVFQAINQDRFGDEAKAARQARRDKQDHPAGYAEYSNLAVQKLGGTKPQNISQLNSERGGTNYLLSSAPPIWKSRGVQGLWQADNAFRQFSRRLGVRDAVTHLRRYLEANPARKLETRERVADLLARIIDAVLQLAAELQQAAPPGWSNDERCSLTDAERLWLDPYRCDEDDAFRTKWLQAEWPGEVAHRFANWLNHSLAPRLAMGDDEHRYWKATMLFELEEWTADLRRDLEQGVPQSRGEAA